MPWPRASAWGVPSAAAEITVRSAPITAAPTQVIWAFRRESQGVVHSDQEIRRLLGAHGSWASLMDSSASCWPPS